MMSSSRSQTKAKPEEPEEVSEAARPPSPPFYKTNAARGIHLPSLSVFQPRDIRFTSSHPVTHVAWSCDGRKLASVGIDKLVRVWTPEKNFDSRNGVQYVGGHEYDVDYVAWNPTHPELFCSSSQRDRRIVFWDARQSRPVQIYSHHVAPSQVNYSPDGKTLCIVTVNHQLWFMTYGRAEGETKSQWSVVKRDPITASTAMFNHVGDGMVLSHYRSNSLMIVDYPTLVIREQPSAHVGGCMAVALDPRGRYLASGGNDSIVNLFDVSEWICANTITACEHAITSLSFSHDGEFLAIAGQGSYIDICATETGLPVYRIPTAGPILNVTWHPSKYIVAYCGQSKFREGATQVAFLSVFGPGI